LNSACWSWQCEFDQCPEAAAPAGATETAVTAIATAPAIDAMHVVVRVIDGS
jgi:hypothetical protein